MRLSLIAFFLLASSIIHSQEPAEGGKSIKNQFDKIYRTSTTYKPKETTKRYKVINIESYNALKVSILDSIGNYKSLILKKEKELKEEKDNNKNTKVLLSKTQAELDVANKKENSISLFGIQLSKTTYNLLLWGIITLLLLGLIYFIFKFFRSNILTKEAQESLIDVEQEFEQHRKKSLEREQKLRRQLQDEINKQRNV